jgi:Flp pilus assembly protein TadB
MAEHTPMPMCPMAATCKSMMSKPMARTFLLVPGVLMIALGVAVLVEPRILVWLVGFAFIAMGFMVLIGSRFMRGLDVLRERG